MDALKGPPKHLVEVPHGTLDTSRVDLAPHFVELDLSLGRIESNSIVLVGVFLFHLVFHVGLVYFLLGTVARHHKGLESGRVENGVKVNGDVLVGDRLGRKSRSDVVRD